MESEILLREEIYRATQRWPFPVFAFLAGCLVGWAVSFVFPPVYQARIDFSLAYDDVKACRNPDDCKNWQLEQVDAFAMSETVLAPALQNLQSSDAYWRETSLEELAGMLDVLWRNTGRWQFIAESENPERSEQAVTAWAEVFLEELQAAQEHALNLIYLNGQIYSLNLAQQQLNQQLLILNRVIDGIENFQAEADRLDNNAPLDYLTRWQLYSMTAQASDNNPAWRELIGMIPDEGAILADYLDWIDLLEISALEEQESLTEQLDSINQDINETLAQIENETEMSHSLSQTLKISQVVDEQPQVIVNRSSPMMAVLGGVVGLLIWGWIWIAIPLRRTRI